jgi:cell division inhibitor SulA
MVELIGLAEWQVHGTPRASLVHDGIRAAGLAVRAAVRR